MDKRYRPLSTQRAQRTAKGTFSISLTFREFLRKQDPSGKFKVLLDLWKSQPGLIATTSSWSHVKRRLENLNEPVYVIDLAKKAYEAYLEERRRIAARLSKIELVNQAFPSYPLPR